MGANGMAIVSALSNAFSQSTKVDELGAESIPGQTSMMFETVWMRPKQLISCGIQPAPQGKKSENEEKTGNSKLWEQESSDESKDSKTPMHGSQPKKTQAEEESGGKKKKAEEMKQNTPNKHSRKGHSTGPKPTVEKAEKQKRPEETPPAESKKPPSKPPPENVDLNDFIVKAAATNLVVDPLLVKKKGNIDDESAEPAKVKARLQRIEEEMKTVDDKTVEEDKKADKKGVKWGDTKCVVYETRDLVTLEDDGGDDAADIY